MFYSSLVSFQGKFRYKFSAIALFYKDIFYQYKSDYCYFYKNWIYLRSPSGSILKIKLRPNIDFSKKGWVQLDPDPGSVRSVVSTYIWNLK